MNNQELVKRLRKIYGMANTAIVTELFKLCVTNPELLSIAEDPLVAHDYNTDELEYARFEADAILEKQLRAKIGYKIIELDFDAKQYTEE